jgi:hypothetical protein
MSNSFADGVSNANRVENEVVPLHWARDSIAKRVPKYAEITALVYDWTFSRLMNQLVVMKSISGGV